MKIQCDVCNKDDASVFCTADEAALCDTCDHRVHHANKLASKHQRFSLIHPSSKQFSLCDICQDRRAFLFCQQDRAILCRECDLSIHTVNEHTLKHNRFLFTGVKLSASSSVYTSPSPATLTSASGPKPQPLIKNSVSATISPAVSNPPSSIAKTLTPTPTPITTTTTSTNNSKSGGILMTNETSSISEYLIETLPGWHVEDFLDFSSVPFGFTKADNGVLPFLDADLESNLSSFSSENMGIWVPQAPAPLHQSQSQMGGDFIGFKETKEAAAAANMKAANNRSMWMMDDGFTVPQISPPSIGSKRSRPF